MDNVILDTYIIDIEMEIFWYIDHHISSWDSQTNIDQYHQHHWKCIFWTISPADDDSENEV